MADKVNIFWFRRDLRLEDNVGLYHALKNEYPVLPLFIFDKEILEQLPEDDARVTFIYDTLQGMRNTLQEKVGSSIAMYHNTPKEVFKQLIKDYTIGAVFTNHDYEPYAKKRDEEIKKLLTDQDIAFNTFKDQVIFEKSEVVKDDGDPYVVYTPYMKKWKANFNASKHLVTYNSDDNYNNFITHSRLPNLSLSDMGFKTAPIKVPDYLVTPNLIQKYEDTRNFPALKTGTSQLGPHLRFGTVSIRKMIKKATEEKNETFWNELIWREFFMQILWHFPETVNNAFRAKYDRIKWRNNEDEFMERRKNRLCLSRCWYAPA